MNPLLLLELCSVFKKVLRDDELRDVLCTCNLSFINLCATLHARTIADLKHHVQEFRDGELSETVSVCETIVHIPTIVRMLNEFVEACEVSWHRTFSDSVFVTKLTSAWIRRIDRNKRPLRIDSTHLISKRLK